ncbi:MAG: hypothetical protein JW991_04195 [Candidatus Pacebacteria bacterium]|nr:hypothetical protein [Candidatus Paceibacterota bacterium]
MIKIFNKKIFFLTLSACLIGSGLIFFWAYPRYSSSRGITSQNCQRNGCSGEICTNRQEKNSPDEEGPYSTCVYQARFHCYRQADCVLLADGQCGFRETAKTSLCLFLAKFIAEPLKIY